MRVVLKALKILGIVVVAIVLLVQIVCNCSFVENKLIGLATEALSKELEAEIQIKDVDISLIGQRISIYGVRLRDQHRRELLHVGKIWGNFRLMPLFQGRIEVKEFRLEDINALLINSGDGKANYQFLLDKTKKKDKKKKKKEGGGGFKFDLQHAMAKKLHVRYNGQDYLLEEAVYSFWRDKRHVDIKGLHFKTDNHKPRKNTNKPHRGFFDAGHLDMVVSLGLDILRADKDTVQAVLSKCSATDSITGFNFHDISAGITYSNKHINLSDVVVFQTDTRFDIPKADIDLPDKKTDKPLHYWADSIRVRTYLKDIARPFAPVLKNFTLPLNVKTSLDGYAARVNLRGIHVNSDDNKLVINATGILRHLEKGHDLHLHFEVHDMVAKPGIKDKIINQFTVKKYMMYQVYALGVVKYHGSFDILWRKQQFRGLLNTEMGNLDFEFQLDGNTKFLSGRVNTDSLNLGKLFKLKKITDIDCAASFNIDISKPRTAERRKEKGGKLPFGTIQAEVRKIGYKNIHIKNIFTNIESDGAVAEGDVTLKGHLTDLMLEFSFTDTDEMHKMKVKKPKLQFRKMLGE